MVTATTIKKGYKQTELGVIPEDWDVKRIDEISTVTNGGTPNTQVSSYWNGLINWFTPTEIGVYKYTYGSFRRITEEGLKNSSARMLPKGTILLTTRAGIGDVSILMNEGCTNQGFHPLIASNNVNYEFLYYLVSTLKKVFVQNASGSTFLEIGPNAIKSIKVKIPKPEEQTAIATALSDTDALIGSLDKLIIKKKDIKQGAMQELLTGKRRLSGFSGKWETKKLSEVAEFERGRDLPKSDMSDEGVYKCIHYGQLFTAYKELVGEIKSRTNSNAGRFYSKTNDVLMPTSDVTPRGLATASCIKENNVILGGGILVIRFNAGYDGLYFSYFVSQNKATILKLVKGSTVFHLYANDLGHLEVNFPEPDEQTAIATLLSGMDTEILNLEQKRDKYIMIKQGMMQQLLTGNIRIYANN